MRKLKKELRSLLQQKDFSVKLECIHQTPPQKTINALFSFLSTTDKTFKEHTILAMAEVVSTMADTDIESARMVMRRLAWSLNEESGWIGWGSAEAMGEIMARNEKLANEYHNLLISYITEGENYLLFEKLREEVVLGIKRLSRARPDLIKEIPISVE